MDKTYRFKDLIELVPFASKGRSLTWDVFGDGLIEYVSDRDGVWLCKHGRGLNEGAGTGLVGLAQDEVAERNIEGVGVVYGMKDGTPLLPLPYFTAHELIIFNSRTAGMITRCNERGENESEWLAELGQMNPDAEELAQVILYGYLPGNAELYSAKALAAVAATETPAPTVAGAAAPTPPVGTTGSYEKKWTPEKLSELRTYRDGHTMPETAKHFGISGARIRQLLPTKKPKAKPFASLIHRIK